MEEGMREGGYKDPRQGSARYSGDIVDGARVAGPTATGRSQIPIARREAQ